MKNQKLKIEEFITSLDRQELDNEQQALLLTCGDSFLGSAPNIICPNPGCTVNPGCNVVAGCGG